MAPLFSASAGKKHSVRPAGFKKALLCIAMSSAFSGAWAASPPVTMPATANVPTVSVTPPTTTVVTQAPATPPVQQQVMEATPVTTVPPPAAVAPGPEAQVVTTATTTGSPSTAAASPPPPPGSNVPPPPLTAAPSSPSPPANSQLSSGQFQEWLHGNGFTTDTSGAAVSSTPTSPVTVVAAPPKIVPSFEDAQRAIRDAAPSPLVEPPQDSEYAFQALMQQNMPMTPRQVIKLRQQIDLSQRAAATLPNIPPKPVSTTLLVNLAPGTTPPAVRLAQGYVSALVFVDSTGAPWPIAAFDIGNPKAVSIQWDGKSNLLLIQAISPYTSGDIVVRLVGLPTPVTLELVAGQRVVDYRVDLHVSGIGPNTHDLPMGTPLPEGANQLLLGVLDGVAPAGSRVLIVRGADSQAWLLGEKMYLRTRLTVLSPGWVGKMTSPDGMQAYELPKTSTVLVSRFGEPAEIKVEGF